jgi:hypothetical protein
MTSHDVVAITRRRLNTKKVGHCGTLDPLATGLLILVIGKGTKISDLLMSEDKEYVGTMKLGEITDSQDADGEVIETREVPPLTKEQIEAAFAKFHGDFYQTPPMVSAIKKEGVPLYKLARQGKTVGARASLRSRVRARDPVDPAAGDRLPRWSAQKAFTFAPTRTISARSSEAGHFSARCEERRAAALRSRIP